MSDITQTFSGPVTELIVDAYGCQADLSDLKQLEKAARASVEAVGASIAASTHYAFQPHGLTLCLVLKESHFIISTWPEHKLAIVNIFLCNPGMDAQKCWEIFSQAVQPENVVFHRVCHEIEPSKKQKKRRAA